MSGPGKYYSSNYAHFIADGTTLEIIRQFEEDAAKRDTLRNAIAEKYGANKVEVDGIYGYTFISDREINNDALMTPPKSYSGRNDAPNTYLINKKTDAGKALQALLDDIPCSVEDNSCFAKRLTGKHYVSTNPDNLWDPEDDDMSFGHYEPGKTEVAATYTRYGDTCIVAVPHTIHGLGIQFNAAAQDPGYAVKEATGYEHKWFTPPESEFIDYSDVVKLQELIQGDQSVPQQVTRPIAVCTPARMRF